MMVNFSEKENNSNRVSMTTERRGRLKVVTGKKFKMKQINDWLSPRFTHSDCFVVGF